MTETSFALHIYYKSDSNKHHLIRNEYDESVDAHQKQSIIFCCQIIVKNLGPTVVKTFSTEVFLFHVRTTQDGLFIIFITDKKYPVNQAHGRVLDVLRNFSQKVSPKDWPNANEETVYFESYLTAVNFRATVLPLGGMDEEVEPLCDVYLSSLSFGFPELTKEIKAKFKVLTLRKKKKYTIRPGVEFNVGFSYIE